ncbi:MAG: hypothetical protein KAJ46_04350, partial [Sedimentisphaerales bacterium]|nr:hypothetical protein [Sedimentisphaerales bacterium]
YNTHPKLGESRLVSAQTAGTRTKLGACSLFLYAFSSDAHRLLAMTGFPPGTTFFTADFTTTSRFTHIILPVN